MKQYYSVPGVKDNIPIPYNKTNKYITQEDVELILSNFGLEYRVKDIRNFQLALTHKSYVINKHVPKDEFIKVEKMFKSSDMVELQEQSNERLEFLGDSVIKVIISEYFYERYPTENEGFMTKLKTKIEDKTSFAKLSKKLGLDEFVLLSKQIEDKSSRTSEKILEDCFEAFMGALFRDSNFEICKQFIRGLLEGYAGIDYADILYNNNNYKDIVQTFYHENGWGHPMYRDIKVFGPPHKRIFIVGILDKNGKIIAKGTDNSKKAAQQKSARAALIHFKQLNDDQIFSN